MKQPLIRLAKTSDLESVFELWVLTSDATYSFLKTTHTEEENRSYFFNVIVADNELWVAVDKGLLSAFMACRDDYIDRLYVHPDFQRKGTGSHLLDKARSLSPQGLRLHTHQKNTGARLFYEKHGFKAIAFGISPPPENEPDVEYHWVPGTAETV